MDIHDRQLAGLERRARQVALVFSDMVLPKLGGWTVFLKLREISPSVRIV